MLGYPLIMKPTLKRRIRSRLTAKTFLNLVVLRPFFTCFIIIIIDLFTSHTGTDFDMFLYLNLEASDEEWVNPHFLEGLHLLVRHFKSTIDLNLLFLDYFN